jgi:methyl-accepting chemotaxis protein
MLVRHRVPSLTMAEETQPRRPGLPNPLAVLRASRTFVGDLPTLAEQLTNSIGDLSDLIAEQASATREQIAATREQIAETKAMRAETVALRQELTLMRESFDQVRDKIPGL